MRGYKKRRRQRDMNLTGHMCGKEGLKTSLVVRAGKESMLINPWFARQGVSCVLVVANGLKCKIAFLM